MSDVSKYEFPFNTDTVDAILHDRAKTNGDWVTMSNAAQALKTVMNAWMPEGHLNAQQQESLELILTKIARIIVGNPSYPDHWDDIAGYAKLANRI